MKLGASGRESRRRGAERIGGEERKEGRLRGGREYTEIQPLRRAPFSGKRPKRPDFDDFGHQNPAALVASLFRKPAEAPGLRRLWAPKSSRFGGPPSQEAGRSARTSMTLGTKIQPLRRAPFSANRPKRLDFDDFGQKRKGEEGDCRSKYQWCLVF